MKMRKTELKHKAQDIILDTIEQIPIRILEKDDYMDVNDMTDEERELLTDTVRKQCGRIKKLFNIKSEEYS